MFNSAFLIKISYKIFLEIEGKPFSLRIIFVCKINQFIIEFKFKTSITVTYLVTR